MKFTVINSLVSKFEDRLNKFIKRYKQVKVVYTKSEPYICEDKTSPKYLKKVRDIDVEGSYKISDWEFIAALEWKEELNENLVKQAPDSCEVPELFRYKNSCDHCNTNRNRKYTIILKNLTTGEFKQVGKSCIKEYIGIDLTDYASYIAMWDSLDEYNQSLDRLPNVKYDSWFYMEEVLNQTCAEVRHRGYISKATAEQEDSSLQSTGSRIWQMFTKLTDFEGNAVVPFYTITKEDLEFTNKVLDFIKSIESDSNYVSNLKLLANSKFEDYKNLGLVVSMVGFYLRETAKIEAAEKAKLNNKSQFIGNIGDKIEFTAAPELLYSADSQFGVIYCYKFKMNEDEIVWKTSKYLEPDAEIVIKGTIKRHNEFRGVKQTEVTRCRIK